jgi:hydroxymethylpyrimidine pyrophosphatase-like HAD family hydrolase
MKIAVDFDGTIVEHKYPKIGRALPFAFEVLKALQKRGHQIILWTYRSDIELDEAIQYCLNQGIEFYAINKNYPEEQEDNKTPRKVHADIYIDDRNLGGLPPWGEIYKMICPEEVLYMDKKKGGFFRIFSS